MNASPKARAGDLVLAYYNEDFIESESGRPFRILAEYLQPLQAFQQLLVDN